MTEEIATALERFTPDGAYDTRAIDEALAALGLANLRIGVPPKKSSPRGPASRRTTESTQRCHRKDRRGWATPVEKGVRREPTGSSQKREERGH